MSKNMINALIEERRGYEMRGLRDRVKEVDERLEALGYKQKVQRVEVASVEPDVEKAAAPKARKRSI
jgi:hypothetical protein